MTNVRLCGRQPVGTTKDILSFNERSETCHPQNGVMLRPGAAVHTGYNLQ